MKRLSLEDLKDQKKVANLEAIKGGTAAGCHIKIEAPPLRVLHPWDRPMH